LRLPKLGLGELRQQWRVLYKAEAPPYLSRELHLDDKSQRPTPPTFRESLPQIRDDPTTGAVSVSACRNSRYPGFACDLVFGEEWFR
jgi:hypothetical protein